MGNATTQEAIAILGWEGWLLLAIAVLGGWFLTLLLAYMKGRSEGESRTVHRMRLAAQKGYECGRTARKEWG